MGARAEKFSGYTSEESKRIQFFSMFEEWAGSKQPRRYISPETVSPPHAVETARMFFRWFNQRPVGPSSSRVWEDRRALEVRNEIR